LCVDVCPGSVGSLAGSMNNFSCIADSSSPQPLPHCVQFSIDFIADIKGALSNVRLQLYAIFDYFAVIECLRKNL